MENAKQKAIEVAWIKLVGEEKLNIIKNYPQNTKMSRPLTFYDSGFAYLRPDDMELVSGKVYWNKSSTRARPIELNGIYDNNGWTKIENDSNLPINDEDLYFLMIDSEYATKGYYANGYFHTVLSSYDKSIVTHYQPEIKPSLPIY